MINAVFSTLFVIKYKKELLLYLIYTEAAGGQIVGNKRCTLACIYLAGASLRCDFLRIVECVLIVHAVVAEGDGLGSTSALKALELDAYGLNLLAGVYYLNDNLACRLLEYG